MSLFTRSLWPDSVRRPYLRLALGMVLAPVLIAGLLSVAAHLTNGASMATREAALAQTREAATVFSIYVLMFALSFGVLGVLRLWATGQRGAFSWMMMGAILGALAGVILGLTTLGEIEIGLLIVCSALSWAMFLTIRWIAGIREG